jgi:hypothetical protein
MRDVVQVLRTMGSEQLFLALVFLAAYSLAIGEFATRRARWIAIATAVGAAVGFAAFSTPWEAGVVVLAFAFVAVGVLSAAAWIVWIAGPSASVAAFDQDSATNLSRAADTASSRPMNTAPILNSPAAE